MKQRMMIVLTLTMGMTAMLAGGCASTETVKTSTAPPIVKSTPPKPVLQTGTKSEGSAQSASKPVSNAPSAPSPSIDVITLPASMGAVSFPHRKHQELLKECGVCHSLVPDKIAELGKDWAHSICKGCHTTMKSGPTSCSGCHKK